MLALTCNTFLQVYGISADKPKSQANWRTKEGISFNLLCDPDKTVSTAGQHQQQQGSGSMYIMLAWLSLRPAVLDCALGHTSHPSASIWLGTVCGERVEHTLTGVQWHRAAIHTRPPVLAGSHCPARPLLHSLSC